MQTTTTDKDFDEANIERTVELFLPVKPAEKKCMQKWMCKSKNRDQLRRILKEYLTNEYVNLKIEKR